MQSLPLVDPDSFKGAMRAWASGVTILTSVVDEQIHGMTVSAFSSVSAVPPLVLVCANQASTTHEVIESAGVFAVNLLAHHQDALSTRFAMGDAAHRFEDVPWTPGERTGAPLLDGSLCSLECRVRNRHPEGTHTIYIGEVLSVRQGDGEPIVYFDGAYRKISG